MALRIAWFKVHYPQAYYAAYFTVRGDGFDAATMLVDRTPAGRKSRKSRIWTTPPPRIQESQTALELVLEMNMRGIHFLPVDLYKSDVRKFLIEDGNLRCPFTSLGGLGESAALTIAAAREQARFLSVEDLKERGKVGTGVIDLLRAHGTLEGLSETSQISMF